MKICENCLLRFGDETYVFCPYCASELVKPVDVCWDGLRDKIAENGVTIEPQTCEVDSGADCNWDGLYDRLEVVFK